MLRFFIFCFCIAAIYATYHDITRGTLPLSPGGEVSQEAHQTLVKSSSYTEFDEEKIYLQVIQPGDTILSIVEKKGQRLPVSIETIIHDFQVLNNGISLDDVIVGKKYRFYDY